MLDSYLQRDAQKEIDGNLARVFVAVDVDDDKNRPVGYIALKTTGYLVPALDSPVPSDTFLYPAEIGCLARDISWRGRGLGEALLLEALKRIERAAREIGLPGVFLTATGEGAVLYERFQFQRIDDSDPDYYLPMIAVRELLEELDIGSSLATR